MQQVIQRGDLRDGEWEEDDLLLLVFEKSEQGQDVLKLL